LKMALVAVRYSFRGREKCWKQFVGNHPWNTLPDYSAGESDQGAADAAKLLSDFAQFVGRTANTVKLRVVPSRPGGAQAEVNPILNQSLLAFLQRSSLCDSGVFQLRAELDSPSSRDYVHIRIAFPGAVPSDTAASGREHPMLIEQFECLASSCVHDLKQMVQERTGFPPEQQVINLGCKRLHDELEMKCVATAAGAAREPLQLHLAAKGALMFLRREGQGHCAASRGDAMLSLELPPCVQGLRQRQLTVDLRQTTLQRLRLLVQNESGLAPGTTQLVLQPTLLDEGEKPRYFRSEEDDATLETLGLSDGCRVCVRMSTTECPASQLSQRDNILLDAATEGDAKLLYARAAQMLGVEDTSAMVLCVGSTAIPQGMNLATAPLADGVQISALISKPLQLSCSTFQHAGAQAAVPSSIACLTSDTVIEVQERFVSAVAEVQSTEAVAEMRRWKVFATDASNWAAMGAHCASLASLVRLLGRFEPLAGSCRLCQMGLANGNAHLVFVEDRDIHVEVQLHAGGERIGVQQLRVPATMRLQELQGLVQRQRGRGSDAAATLSGECSWVFAVAGDGGRADDASTSKESDAADESSPCSKAGKRRSSSQGPVAAMMASAGAVVKAGRRSISDTFDASERKRRRLTSSPLLTAEDFLGDLLAQRPANQDLPDHFLCPISYDVMKDPVLVVGSGNTYDRKSIECHFGQKHTDPLSNVELRGPDRRLVPNNTLRSQIEEAVQSQVQLRLAAHFEERRQDSCSGDAQMAGYLGWCAQLLRGAANSSSQSSANSG